MDQQPDKARYRAGAGYALFFVVALLFGIVLAVRIRDVLAAVSYVFGALWPVTTGLVIAYLLSPCVRFFQKKPFGKMAKDGKLSASRVLSVCCTFLVLLLIVALILWILVPQLASNYTELANHAEEYIATAQRIADRIIASSAIFGDSSTLTDLLGTDLDSYLADLLVNSLQFAGSTVSGIVSVAGGLIDTAIKLIFSLILSFGILLFEEPITHEIRRIAGIVLSHRAYGFCASALHSVNRAFGAFFTGRILDSLLVGVVGLLIFYLTGMPYAPLLAVLLAVFNMIPYFGSLIAGVVGGVIILVAKPSSLLLFIVIDLAIEQIDGNFLSPKVLGESVGIKPIWVISSISVAGTLFGIIGLLLAVPVVAVFGDFIKWLCLTVNKNSTDKKQSNDEQGGAEA